MVAPIRVFVGCAVNDDLESQLVLEHSIRKHASLPVEFTWMQKSGDPQSPFFWQKWNTSTWATPFTAFRWAIPALCEYQGRAIYFDSDFIVRADLAELWNQPFYPDAVIISGTRFDCFMWNCERAREHVPTLETLCSMPDLHANLSRYFLKHKPPLIQDYKEGDWNSLDISLPNDFNRPGIKAIHYTQMHTQLQLKYAQPRLVQEGRRHWYNGHTKPHPMPELQALFDSLYEEGLAAGLSLEQYRVV